ncbi:MAG: histidine phosphatase family protein [Oligoflexales bacterium]
MTKTLVLLRHGEAASTVPGYRDYDRNLTKTGCEQAKKVSSFLAGFSLPPLYAYVSSACRTQETYGYLSVNLVHNTLSSKRLYEGTVEDVRELLLDTPDAEQAVLVVGHNPTISWFAELLTQQPLEFHPSGCAVLECDGNSWADVVYDCWTLKGVNSSVGS